MRKRILPFAAGVLLGAAITGSAGCLALAWSLWPNRDLTRAVDYIRSVAESVHDRYVDPKAAEYDALSKSAIHGMVESLDPHSEYLEAKDNAQLEEDLSGEFGGIGVQVEVRDRRVVIVAPMPGTPGDRAGIQRGDEIVSIDGRTLGGNATMDDVVTKLRGKPKTRVALGLYRPSARRHLDLVLVREVIKVASVTDVRVLPDGIGYVQITDFSEHTGDQFADALDTLLKKRVNSLIIDLRNNPGGLLDAAVDVSEQFFKKGELIVSTRGRRGSDNVEYRAEAEGQPLDLPVAVLINAGTASAAEIVTGALKDTGKAVVVGERSFGKGSVQSILPLRDGEALRLTTAKYYTPSGVSIHEKGISPNVEVIMTPEEDSRIERQRSRPDITDPKEFEKRFGFAPIEDRQLEAAQDVLRAVDILDSQADAARKGPAR